MAWCWELGFIPGCCRWLKTADIEGLEWWWVVGGGGLLGVGKMH